MSEKVYFCEQGNPYCGYPHCVCNTVRPSFGGAKIDAGTLIHKLFNDKGKSLKSQEFDLVWYFINNCSLSSFKTLKELICDPE